MNEDTVSVNPRKTQALQPSPDGRASIIRALARELAEAEARDEPDVVLAEENGAPDIVVEYIENRIRFFRALDS